jgi:GMP synthase (glutamine-hydrolysing)
MGKVTDAMEKRLRFRTAYQTAFMEVVRKAGAQAIIQGTIVSDRIESGATGARIIKPHHNVGLDTGSVLQIAPIDHLFKYEVSALARSIGLPESVWNRQPFPGPGLFLRIIRVPITSERLQIVSWADDEVRKILVRQGIYKEHSQHVVAYSGLKMVGVKGDARVYKGGIIVRAVNTIDFMTAKGVRLPVEAREEIEATLSGHPEINWVMYHEMPKPPATIELE